MNNAPLKSGDIIARRIEKEIVLIQNNGLAVHVLNNTAASIWELCDGTHSVEQITSKLCEQYDVSEEEASADVRNTLERLTKLGVM
jgi:plasmid maintenance system antidote protein VapI